MGTIAIGTVRGSEVTKNKDSDEDSRILQVEITNAEDLQSIEQVGQVGEDSNPQPGARVIIVDLGPSYRVAIATSDGITPTVAEGEKEFYSYDANLIKKAFLKLLKGGIMELNGNTDFAVAFDDLKTGFDLLVSQVDANLDLISTAIGLLGGTYTKAALTASIDASKVTTVKLP